MIAIVSNDKKPIFDDSAVIVKINSNVCVIRRGHDVPDGWSRIPFHIAKMLISRQNSQWVQPQNSYDGMKLVESMEDDWLKYLTTTSPMPFSMNNSMAVPLKSTRKTMQEIQQERERRRRW